MFESLAAIHPHFFFGPCPTFPTFLVKKIFFLLSKAWPSPCIRTTIFHLRRVLSRSINYLSYLSLAFPTYCLLPQHRIMLKAQDPPIINTHTHAHTCTKPGLRVLAAAFLWVRNSCFLFSCYQDLPSPPLHQDCFRKATAL